jgi:glycosyltransferase 2 family protein
MKAWMRAARIVWLVALAAVLAWVLWTRRDDLAGLVAGARPGLLAAALALGFGQLAVNAAFWSSALRALDAPARWPTVLGATARSVPARYVPGSVWYAVSRVGLLRAAGLPGRSLAAVAVLETALSVAVVLPLGAALLLAAGRLPGGGAGLVAAVVVLAVAGSPPVVNRLLAVWARRRGGPAPRLGAGAWVRLLGWMVLFWCWSATTFTVYLHAFPGVDVGSVVEVAGAFMVAWGIGFLALFAPQGAGVFEVAAAALLAGQVVGGLAVVVGGYRALMAVRDAVAFAAATVAGRVRRG